MFNKAIIALFSAIILFGCTNNSESIQLNNNIKKDSVWVIKDSSFDGYSGSTVLGDLSTSSSSSNEIDNNWMAPILLVNNNKVITITECSFQEDTVLLLSEHIDKTKTYLNSDSLYSFGTNGIQLQNFSGINCNNDRDCSRQIALDLTKTENNGFLVGKNFINGDSFELINFQLTKNIDSDYGYHKIFYSKDSLPMIEVRGNRTKQLNDELGEEWFEYRNCEYRVFYFGGSQGGKTHWNKCPDVTSPQPLCILTGQDMRIIWGSSDGIGDYQLTLSRLSLESETSENGYTIQVSISLGCD